MVLHSIKEQWQSIVFAAAMTNTPPPNTHTHTLLYITTHVVKWVTFAHQNNSQSEGNLCNNLHRVGRNSCKNTTQMEQNNCSQIHPGSMCHDQHFGKVLWKISNHKIYCRQRKLPLNAMHMKEFMEYIKEWRLLIQIVKINESDTYRSYQKKTIIIQHEHCL